ncbi:MAG: helix-turn-helix transcriptional regulator [Clostridia bacterium]|nr:helix-turn-helix transcriptional regulator [Clostridia bacterium]
MNNKTMGELICSLRKEKGMTQRELAEKLNVTDKAVSKWERDASYPDTGSLPALAEILGVSVEELLGAKKQPPQGHKGAGYLADLILRAIPVAMGVALVVTALLGGLDLKGGFSMAGIGLVSVGILLLKNK